MRLTVRRPGRPPTQVILRPNDFVAAGGQGAVHARDGVAYKIYADPSQLPPPDKWTVLAKLRDPRLVVPTGTLHDAAGTTVGVCMPLVPDAHPLARLATASFRRQHGIDDGQVLDLLNALRQAIINAHAAGVHIVDLNPYNVLLTANAQDVALIDADSWQTPAHPATAVLAAVRDPRAAHFDEASDWFAFAVVAAWVLLGMHPYKGSHPTLKGLAERMTAGVSVFDPVVRRPPAARDPASVPPTVRDWLAEVLSHVHRRPPPPICGSVAHASAPPQPLSVTLLPITTARAPIEAAIEALGATWWLTPDGLFRAGERRAARPPGQISLGQVGQRVIAAGCRDRRLHAVDDMGQALHTPLAVRGVTHAAGKLIALTADALVALRPVGQQLAPVVLARVRATTTLFPGVALMPLPDGLEALVPGPRGMQRVHLPIATHRVLDAQADGNVLCLVTRSAGGNGELERWIVRLGGTAPDIDRQPTDHPGATCVTLPSGIAVLRMAGDALCVRPAQPKARGRRTVQDQALGGEGRLVRLDTAVGLIRGRYLWRMRLR